MSYSRTYSKTIRVRYEDSVDYPPSKNGGTIPVRGYVEEVVDVNIHVDTEDFDLAVVSCNNDINLLTDAVVATDAAQCQSIAKNSERVGSAITDGFFKTVRSEISQQITVLKAKIDATLAHLHELSKRCNDKQRQMKADYDRLCSRYTKTFEELNKELENRIHALDAPVFDIQDEVESFSTRNITGDYVPTVTVTGAEEANLNAVLESSIMKQHAKDTLGVICNFIARQKASDSVLRRSTIPSEGEPWRFSPVMFMEAVSEGNYTYTTDYAPSQLIPEAGAERLRRQLADVAWKPMTPGAKKDLTAFFESEMAASFAADDPHTRRIKDYVRRLFANDVNSL